MARRASQLASACSARLSEASKAAGTETALAADDLLRGIQYCRVHSPVEFIAMIRILGSILEEHPDVWFSLLFHVKGFITNFLKEDMR